MSSAMWKVGALAVFCLSMGWSQAASGARTVNCRVELDRDILLADDPQTAIIKVTLEAPPPPDRRDRPPVNLAIVLDRSGSMAGEKIEKAKEAAIEALNRLSEKDLFSLVIYDDHVESIVPAQSAGHRDWIISRIREIRPGGSTALFGGVSQGASEVRKNLSREYVNRIVLLSDGLANVGPSNPSDLARLGVALAKEGISVSTVGVGTDYNEDLMTKLSQNSDGNAYFVEASSDLPRIFASELGDVLSVVAQKVILGIEFRDGSRPIRIIGRDGRIDGDRVELNLNQLYGGQEKYALIEVDVPPTPAEKTREIAVARVSYDSAISNERETSSGSVTARFSARKGDVVRSVNEPVQQEVLKNIAAETQDKAVDLWDAGQQDEALKVMKDKKSEMEVIIKTYNLGEEAAAPVDSFEGSIQRLESDGMDQRQRKSFRTDSFQIRNQQSSE